MGDSYGDGKEEISQVLQEERRVSRLDFEELDRKFQEISGLGTVRKV